MTELKLVNCIPKHDRYLKAFLAAYTNYVHTTQDTTQLQKVVLLGVKSVNTHKYPNPKCIERHEIENHYQFIQWVQSFMCKLTPRQFINLFPISKEYDGEKYCIKDYFYTIEMLKQYDQDKPIGEHLTDLLWDYQNDDIREFMLNTLTTASDLRKLDTGLSIAEEWALQNDIPTYTVNESAGYMYNSQTHQAVPYHKSTTSYIRVVQ